MSDLYYEEAVARQREFLNEAEKRHLAEEALQERLTLSNRLGEWLIKVGNRLQGQVTITSSQQLHNLK